jgi:hypothetical protein
MKPDGGLMVGMVRNVRDGVATGYEFLLLREHSGGITFSAHPSGQAPADFRAMDVSGNLVRVENADHDFPKAIAYHRVGADSIVAKVYGEIDAADPAFEVHYSRGPC